MNRYQRLLAGVLVSALVAIAGAQDQSAPPSPPANTQDGASQKPPAEPPVRPPAAEPSDDDDVFIPTEEVQAAEELAFPVDI